MNAESIYQKIELLLNRAEALKKKSLADISGELSEEEDWKLISDITGYVEVLCQQQTLFNGIQQIKSVEASLQNIQQLSAEENDKAYKKIQYELVPLIENMRMDFYYYVWVYPDKNKIEAYFQNERKELYRNPYAEEAQRTGKYKYDLSIVVLGYNKLEYTKVCVGYLLKVIPKNISYELILMNHGSSDGTKEYFEEINPDKQIDIAVNGGGVDILDRIVEGHYVLKVSNDVVVTEHAIENMYRCITSDPSIAWVVAATPNISNQQDINGEYDDLDGMFEFAKRNNVSDERRWEQKIRICNPIDIYEIQKKLSTICGKIPAQANGCFIDDKVSMLFRRAGYKMFLAKDAYCYHFGSVTLQDEIQNGTKEEALYYTKGRIQCLKDYGLDPWGYGYVYDYKLFCALEIKKQGRINILGINPGLCANIVKLRDKFKEVLGNKDVWMTGFIQDSFNEPDLRSFADEVFFCKDWSLFDQRPEKLYDYILIEQGLEEEEHTEIIEKIYQWKKPDGIILLRSKKEMALEELQSKYPLRRIESHHEKYSWVEIQ